jgi:hypothetical protein
VTAELGEGRDRRDRRDRDRPLPTCPENPTRFPVHRPSDIACYRTERFLHPHHHTGARVPCLQWADSPNTQLEFPRLMRRWFERTCLQPRRTEQLTTQRPQAKPSLVQLASNSTYPLALRLGRHFIQDPIELHVVMHTTGLAVTRSGRFLRERGPSGCSTPTGSTITRTPGSFVSQITS